MVNTMKHVHVNTHKARGTSCCCGLFSLLKRVFCGRAGPLEEEYTVISTPDTPAPAVVADTRPDEMAVEVLPQVDALTSVDAAAPRPDEMAVEALLEAENPLTTDPAAPQPDDVAVEVLREMDTPLSADPAETQPDNVVVKALPDMDIPQTAEEDRVHDDAESGTATAWGDEVDEAEAGGLDLLAFPETYGEESCPATETAEAGPAPPCVSPPAAHAPSKRRRRKRPRRRDSLAAQPAVTQAPQHNCLEAAAPTPDEPVVVVVWRFGHPYVCTREEAERGNDKKPSRRRRQQAAPAPVPRPACTVRVQGRDGRPVKQPWDSGYEFFRAQRRHDRAHT